MTTTLQRLIATTAAVLVCAVASAATELEDAFEVYSNNVELPSSIAGSVILRECNSCDRVTVRVRTESQYFVGDAAVSLEQLKQIFESRKARDESFGLTVFRDRASGYVSRIILER